MIFLKFIKIIKFGLGVALKMFSNTAILMKLTNAFVKLYSE